MGVLGHAFSSLEKSWALLWQLLDPVSTVACAEKALGKEYFFPFSFCYVADHGVSGHRLTGSLDDPLGIRSQASLKALKPELSCLWLLGPVSK